MYSGGPYDMLYQTFWILLLVGREALGGMMVASLALAHLIYADDNRSMWEDGPDKWWWWTTVNPYSAGQTRAMAPG